MLNECLRKDESQSVEINGCIVRVGDTGIPAEDSVNLGPKRLEKQRAQRMRRRHERGFIAGGPRPGWAIRMI